MSGLLGKSDWGVIYLVEAVQPGVHQHIQGLVVLVDHLRSVWKGLGGVPTSVWVSSQVTALSFS